MKYSIALFAAVLILSSCKKNDIPQPVVPDTTNNQSTALKKAMDSLGKDPFKSARGALDALIHLPGGGPIPPHLSPIKDITRISETDSTASYALTSGSTGAKLKVEMKRRVDGADTIWVVSRIEGMK